MTLHDILQGKEELFTCPTSTLVVRTATGLAGRYGNLKSNKKVCRQWRRGPCLIIWTYNSACLFLYIV